MRRAAVCLLLCLLTGCRALAAPVVLPDPADVVGVTVSAGEGRAVRRSGDYAAVLIRAMEGARPTCRASIPDAPAVPGAIRVEFLFKSGGSSRVFVYTEQGRVWLEQPYQSVCEADEKLMALLGEGDSPDAAIGGMP